MLVITMITLFIVVICYLMDIELYMLGLQIMCKTCSARESCAVQNKFCMGNMCRAELVLHGTGFPCRTCFAQPMLAVQTKFCTKQSLFTKCIPHEIQLYT